jgi:Tfp pilus assembly protein PilO
MSGTSIISYIIITLSLGYAFIYPTVGDLSQLSEQKQKYLDLLEKVENIEDQKNKLLAKFNEISAEDRKSIETILPSSFDFVRLVSQIDAVAKKYGIAVEKVASRELSSSVGNSIETAAPAKIYNSAVISFSFASNYENFRNFLNDLEKSLRILDSRSVKLTTQEKGALAFELEFETYWLKE